MTSVSNIKECSNVDSCSSSSNNSKGTYDLKKSGMRRSSDCATITKDYGYDNSIDDSDTKLELSRSYGEATEREASTSK